MGWDEAVRMVEVLLTDPSSHVAAAAAGWTNPVSREWLALADLYDLYGRSKSKRHKPYPRPWVKTRRSFGTGVSRERWAQIKGQAAEIEAHSVEVR